jgi:hypothetical protein
MAGDYTLNIGGYLWTTAKTGTGLSYDARHVFACGGDPRRVQECAMTFNYEDEHNPDSRRGETP